ncbi:uncharacterized protein [Temnothorax longispinosus]|uniref:uncharacterized protein isoform X3 n=1 Tax=Temnothorax longispinosus TaxID=300112 RepID=UPI003A99563B
MQMRIVKYSMTVIIALTRKRSKLWNYFEKLNHSLVKCTTCKKEIKTPNPTRRTKIMKAHILNVHGISLDDETVTLPDDLKQYYSELTGYKAKCNNCGKAVSFLTNIENLRVHLRRHSTRIQSRDETTPTKKRSKLWNYFEELKPKLLKCTSCKKEIKVSDPTGYTKVMRMHLSRRGIFLDNDILSLPDDLRQYYSMLPGYKAKCNNCGETISFLTTFSSLRRHFRRHCTRTHSQDETAQTKKRSKLWNYFEYLKPKLLKCTTCKKEIKISHPKHYVTRMRMRIHLSRHGIFLDTLPDDLRQCYSELPGYKAKCNNCGETVSFLTNFSNLRRHFRRHCTRIQNQNETVMVPRKKRSKLWNYFEKLKPKLLKCTTCKKEIKVSYPKYRITIMRKHLSRHEIFLDDDIRTLPDDLRQCYSELPGYKAKCNNCGETVSFLTTFSSLRRHFRRHCTRTHSQDDLSTSTSTCCVMDSSAKRQNQDTSSLPIQSFKETTEKTETLDEPSTSISTSYDTNHTAECQSQETVDLALQTCEQSRKQTRARVGTAQTKKRSKLWNYFEELKPLLVKCKKCKKHFDVPDKKKLMRTFRRHLFNVHGIFLDNDTLSLPDDLKQYCSELPGYKAKCNNCGQTVSFLTNFRNLRKHLKRHSTRIQSRDETTPTKKRSKLWNYFEELKPKLLKCTSCKKEIKVSDPTRYTKVMRMHLSRHGIFLDNDILSLPDDLRQYYSMLPGYKAKCNNCGKAMSFLTNFSNLREHLRRHYFSNKNPESK